MIAHLAEQGPACGLRLRKRDQSPVLGVELAALLPQRDGHHFAILAEGCQHTPESEGAGRRGRADRAIRSGSCAPLIRSSSFKSLTTHSPKLLMCPNPDGMLPTQIVGDCSRSAAASTFSQVRLVPQPIARPRLALQYTQRARVCKCPPVDGVTCPVRARWLCFSVPAAFGGLFVLC